MNLLFTWPVLVIGIIYLTLGIAAIWLAVKIFKWVLKASTNAEIILEEEKKSKY